MSVFKKALQEFAASNERAWDRETRAQTVGASEIGQCARKIGYAKHPEWETVPDEEYVETWGAKARGSYYENNFWVPAIRQAFGAKALYTGDEQRTFTLDCLSATPDGVIVDQPVDALASLGVADLDAWRETGGNCFVVDCKTIDPRARINEPKPEHVHQVITQIGLIRETTKLKPTYGVLTYTDASFWDVIHEFAVEFDFNVYKHSKMRAANIMYADDAQDLPAEGWIAGRRDCQYCPFTTACGIDRRDLPSNQYDKVKSVEGLDKQRLAELKERAAAMIAARRLSKASEAKAKAEQEEVKNLMRNLGRRKIEDEGYKFSWSEVKGREGFDKKGALAALVAYGRREEEFVQPGTPGDRLNVVVPGMETEGEENE